MSTQKMIQTKLGQTYVCPNSLLGHTNVCPNIRYNIQINNSR